MHPSRPLLLRILLPTFVLVAITGCGGRDTREVEEEQPIRVARPAGVARSSVQFRVAVDDSVAGSEVMPGPEGTRLILTPTVVLTERDITGVEVGPGMVEPHYVVYLHLTPDAAARLRPVSLENVGRDMAVVVDGEVLLTAEIRDELPSPFVIEGGYSRGEATRVAERLAP